MERWKTIKGFSIYEVSTKGRVRNAMSGQIRKQQVSIHGYAMVQLYGDKCDRKNWAVHRLVATHFIPNPEKKREVNHINLIRTDNRIENLEWCTASENMLHSAKMKKARYERKKSKKTTARKNLFEHIKHAIA